MNLFKGKIKNAFHNVSKTEDGKVFLAELYSFCDTGRIAVKNDPISTGVNCGLEMVSKHIKKLVNQDDNSLERLLLERQELINKSRR